MSARTAVSRAGTLLPQHPSRARDIERGSEWLFEPFWHGERLLAFVDRGAVSLTGARGERVEDTFREAAAALAAAAHADQAIVDGVWVSRDTAAADEPPTATFVAVDLLELDGQELLDVPLLERRRLLESIVVQSPRVRVTPAVRHPVEGWLSVWSGLGFASYVAKHANSRYAPGQRNAEWVRMSAGPPRHRTLTGALLGQRGRDPRIED